MKPWGSLRDIFFLKGLQVKWRSPTIAIPAGTGPPSSSCSYQLPVSFLSELLMSLVNHGQGNDWSRRCNKKEPEEGGGGGGGRRWRLHQASLRLLQRPGMEEEDRGFFQMFHSVTFRAWNSDVRLKLVTSVSSSSSSSTSSSFSFKCSLCNFDQSGRFYRSMKVEWRSNQMVSWNVYNSKC